MEKMKLAIAELDEGSHQFASAFTFSKDIAYAVAEVIAPPPSAALLLEIDLRGGGVATRELLELPCFSLNYHAESANLHYVIDNQSRVHRVADGKVTVHQADTTSELSGIARVSATSIAILGEDGGIFVLEGDTFRKIETGTEERILAAHFVRPDLAYAVGHFGTFLTGGVQGFRPVELPDDTFAVDGDVDSRYPIVAVHAKEDGAVLLGTGEGPAFVFEGGKATRLTGLDEESTVQTIGVFDGVEYWGVSGEGLFTRSGDRLSMRFPTGGADGITVGKAMALKAGSYLYLFDGKDWVELSFDLSLESLIERIPLDFDPR